MISRILARQAALLTVCTVASSVIIGSAHAQSAKPLAPTAPRSTPANSGPPNALQGFSQNRGQPVQIEAKTLEVRDKDRVATFTGDVHVIQGDTDMRSQIMVVFYEDDASVKKSVKAAQPGPGGSSRIKRLEATGNVIVTQKDQTATGNKGIYDVPSNTVTLIGNVVMSQCQSIVRGERLTVDLTTGVSHVETGREGGRVQALIQRGGSSENCKDSLKNPGTN